MSAKRMSAKPSSASAVQSASHLSQVPLRLRQPGMYTLIVAAALGVFGASLNYSVTGGTGPLEPWRIGCLLGALGLWSWAAMDGAALARVRSNGAPEACLAQGFAYGYFFSAALVLMQIGETDFLRSWLMNGAIGMVFAAVIVGFPQSGRREGAEAFFEHTHALERGVLQRALFILWPPLSVSLVSWMAAQLAKTGAPSSTQISVLMVLFVAIWPLPFNVAPAYRRMFVGLMLLGLMLLTLVIVVP